MVQPVDDDTFTRIIWSSLSIGTFILVLLLIFSIKNFFCIKSKTASQRIRRSRNFPSTTICNDRIPVDAALKYLQILHVSGYILCNTFWILYWYILLNPTGLSSTQRSDYLVNFNVLANIFWTVGCLSFFSLLILRLYAVFDNTVYQLPNYAFIIWTVLLFLIFICYILFIVDAYGNLDDDTFNNIVFPSLVILNIITGLSLLYVFGAKLFKLAMQMSVHDMNQFSSTNQGSTMTMTSDFRTRTTTKDESYKWVEYETQLDTKQINLLKAIAKNALLGGIGIMGIQIYFIFQWIELYKRTHSGWAIWSYYLCTRYILRATVMSIEIFCVYLSFGANKKLYGVLCGKCANRLQLCCQIRIKRKMDNANDYEFGLL